MDRKEAIEIVKKNCDSSISEMVLKGSMSAYQSLLHFLGTLETKEVDLEKELEDWLGERVGKWTGKECERMCHHFFELGLKAQKEVKNEKRNRIE